MTARPTARPLRLAGAITTLAALVALGVALAGCAGGSSGMSKQEYTKRAAAICRDADESVTKARGDATTPVALAASIDRVVSIEQGAARRVRALQPPHGDEAVLRQWLALVDQSIAQLGAAARAAAAGDGPAATAANQRAQAIDRQADAIADRYGLDACAAGG